MCEQILRQRPNTIQILWIVKNHDVPNNCRYRLAAIKKTKMKRWFSPFKLHLYLTLFLNNVERVALERKVRAPFNSGEAAFWINSVKVFKWIVVI